MRSTDFEAGPEMQNRKSKNFSDVFGSRPNPELLNTVQFLTHSGKSILETRVNSGIQIKRKVCKDNNCSITMLCGK